jgi:hypothetical protein
MWREVLQDQLPTMKFGNVLHDRQAKAGAWASRRLSERLSHAHQLIRWKACTFILDRDFTVAHRYGH